MMSRTLLRVAICNEKATTLPSSRSHCIKVLLANSVRGGLTALQRAAARIEPASLSAFMQESQAR